MLDIIQKIGVVPVIKLDDASQAVPLAKALIAGDVPVAEVTFRTAAAEESIKRMTAEVPEILVGAGTVLTLDQLDKALCAGAKFIVSPGFDPEIVHACIEREVLVFPGCVTPSEIIQAIKLGLDIIKFFPANIYGGLAGIKALAPVFPNARFMPTGGVNASNLAEFLKFDKVVACGGSWMVSADLAETTRLCLEARKIVKGVRP